MRAPAENPELRRLLAVARALASGRRIRIRYRDLAGESSRRVLTPLGLAWRGDHWLLAAHCHLRRALRHFRVDRIELAGAAPGRVDGRLAPPGFDARFFSAEGYLSPGARSARSASVRLLPPFAAVASALFPAALLEWPCEGEVLCHLRVSDPAALMSLVASLGNAARIVERGRRPSGVPGTRGPDL